MFSEHIGTIKTSLWIILKTAYFDFFWISFALHIWNHRQLPGRRWLRVLVSALVLAGELWTNRLLLWRGYFLNTDMGKADGCLRVAVVQKLATELCGRCWAGPKGKATTWASTEAWRPPCRYFV